MIREADKDGEDILLDVVRSMRKADFTCSGDGMIDYNEFVTMMVAKVSLFRLSH